MDSAGNELTVKKIHSFFKKKFPDVEINDVFALDSDYDTGRTVRFLKFIITFENFRLEMHLFNEAVLERLQKFY